jgi:hypothetical protein
MMSAQILDLRTETLNALVNKTRAAWDRADAKKADADDWARRTGQYLVDLKRRAKAEGRSWLEVLEKLGRSQQRASELMQLAHGRVTVEEQRARTREAMKKTRVKQKSLSRDSARKEPEEEYAPPTMEERLEISLSNLCGDILARAAYFDKTFPGWRSVSLPPHTKTLVREAAAALASLAETVAGD